MNYCPNCGHNLNNYTQSAAKCPNELHCMWKKQTVKGDTFYTCGHGVVQSGHPQGWCDGTCCR